MPGGPLPRRGLHSRSDLNQQSPTPPIKSNGREVEVYSIFPTIQGEGPFVGRPAVFIRLANCNLRCPLCDTDYTLPENIPPMPVDMVAREARRHGSTYQLAVITGGEPFRQNIYPLVTTLLSYGFEVQVETNGMLPVQDWDQLRHLITELGRLHVVISPKTGKVWTPLASFAAAYKYVVKADQVAEDGLPITALDHDIGKHPHIARPPEDYTGPVYVQPADEKNEEAYHRNMTAAVASVNRKPGRRLCLQIHKYAGLE